MALDIVWRGTSQNTYTFETHPIGTKFRDISGIYIMCSLAQNDRWKALYVGETESFFNRLVQGVASHEGYGRAYAMGMTHIGVMFEGNSRQRLAIETDLRHGLRPPANMQGVGGY